jgi:ribosomal protein S18 acetylase RimI-like enzyme
MAMQFRAARDADAADVADVYLASRKVHLPFAPLAHRDEDVREWIRDVLIPAGGVTVAVEGSSIVGMIAVSIDELGYAWIEHLYLEPDCVRQGRGSKLLRRILDALPRPVRLYTFAENVSARRFYERHGFVPISFGDGSENEEGCPDVLYELAR